MSDCNRAGCQTPLLISLAVYSDSAAERNLKRIRRMSGDLSGNSSSSSSSSSSGGGGGDGGGSISRNDDSLGSQVSCSICSERYKAEDELHAGSCGHVFHLHCLHQWQEQSETCPICRRSNVNYFQIYLNFEDLSPCQCQQNSTDIKNLDTSEYENLLYESRLYRDEIEYLNTQIEQLESKVNVINLSFDDSD